MVSLPLPWLYSTTVYAHKDLKLDCAGEAHFLKDAESDSKESLARSSAFSSGDEGSLSKAESILPIDAVESGVKITPAEGEKGESSDEKESDLELRFEGRKASYLLVQQVRYSFFRSRIYFC